MRCAGAVAGLTTVKNPIAAARLVMERSPHVLLAGRFADAFAQQHGAISSPTTTSTPICAGCCSRKY